MMHWDLVQLLSLRKDHSQEDLGPLLPDTPYPQPLSPLPQERSQPGRPGTSTSRYSLPSAPISSPSGKTTARKTWDLYFQIPPTLSPYLLSLREDHSQEDLGPLLPDTPLPSAPISSLSGKITARKNWDLYFPIPPYPQPLSPLPQERSQPGRPGTSTSRYPLPSALYLLSLREDHQPGRPGTSTSRYPLPSAPISSPSGKTTARKTWDLYFPIPPTLSPYLLSLRERPQPGRPGTSTSQYPLASAPISSPSGKTTARKTWDLYFPIPPTLSPYLLSLRKDHSQEELGPLLPDTSSLSPYLLSLGEHHSQEELGPLLPDTPSLKPSPHCNLHSLRPRQ